MGNPNRTQESHKVDIEPNGSGITVDGWHVSVLPTSSSIQIGCHTISRKAWERLKILIDGGKHNGN